MIRKLPYLIAFLAFLFSVKNVTSQVVNQKIIDAFGSEYVDQLVKTNENHLNYLNCFLDYSYEIVENTYVVGDKYPLASSFLKKLKHKEVNDYVPDINDFNALMYNFPRDRELKKSYRIDQTDYLIVFFSEREFAEILNKYMKKN